MNCLIPILIIFSFGMCSSFNLSTCFENRNFTGKDGRITFYKATFCCSNYQNISGVCAACRIGFTSQYGSMCHKCDKGFYGYRCLHACICSYKSCNHQFGCIIVKKSTDIIQLQMNISSAVTIENTSLKEFKKGSSHIMLYILCTGVLTVLVGFGAICLKCKGNVTDFNNAFKIGVANSRDL